MVHGPQSTPLQRVLGSILCYKEIYFLEGSLVCSRVPGGTLLLLCKLRKSVSRSTSLRQGDQRYRHLCGQTDPVLLDRPLQLILP